MIIGIHGKIGSGKDTVASMWQYIFNWQAEPTYAAYGALATYKDSKVQIKRFAGILKQIVALLTSCDIKDLEREDFKNSVIPGWDRSNREAKEWMDLRGFSYHADDDAHTIRVEALSRGFIFERTYREMLQELGTNIFRTHLHEDTWVKALMSQYKPNYKSTIRTEYPIWLVPDLRFPNEAKAIIDAPDKGILIKVERPGIKTNDHSSETALDNYSGWHHVITNDGTLEDLFNKILIIHKTIQHGN